MKKIISILVEGSVKENDLQIDELNIIDKDDFLIDFNTNKIYRKAKVTVEYEDGNKDIIYTMNPELYKNLLKIE